MADQAERRGRRALVYYRGGVQGEKIVDDNFLDQPAEILLGCGRVPPGIEEALLEMQPGEERIVTVPPEKGYGDHDPDKVQRYPRLFFENGYKLKVGDWLTWKHPVTQYRIPVRVIATTKDTVTLDFNHPFAGKSLEYRLKLVDIV